MEVLPCSTVQCVGQSDCPQESSGTTPVNGESNCLEHERQVPVIDRTVEGLLPTVEVTQLGSQGEVKGAAHELHMSEGCRAGASNLDCQVESQKSSSGSHGSESFDDDDINAQNYSTEPSLISDNGNLKLDGNENGLPYNSREGESSHSDSTWLECHESVPLWVKWRGKWQAGIRCARADWPLSTLRAKPTHDRKKYVVIFFPHTRNYSWADMLLVRSIDEIPQPIAYKTHNAGLRMVDDLSVAHRFIMQKLAVGMLNIVDQFHTEALIETARNVVFWKEFAMEASRCTGYSDLGKMLLKLQSMISRSYINHDWLQNSNHSWVQRCQNACSAELVELLKEELVECILWNEVQSLRNAALQPTLGSEWRTWKHEVMKWFSTSHPISNGGDFPQHSSDSPVTPSLQVSRKRPKLEVRRAEAHASQMEYRGSEEAIAIEIDSEFFNNREALNAATLASEPDKEVIMKEVAPPSGDGAAAAKWDDVVVATENSVYIQSKDVEMTPVNSVAGIKSPVLGTKSRQCIAYIEAKGRQCVRWANDGDVYCCVHLSSRFTGSSAKSEGAHSVDTPMCEGTTVLGTKCKHRSLHGSSFCKKHRPKTEPETILSTPENGLKRMHEENMASLETVNCREMVLVGDVGAPLEVDPVRIMAGDGFSGREGLFVHSELSAKTSNVTEEMRCIGSGLHDSSNSCLESPKRHSLYCEKHLPTWLKRARNGKSKIISKEVFIDLLKDCHSHEHKLHIHQACELFYKLFKSILSLRNPVPKNVQFQWALSEASKNLVVGEIFTKLVCSEKERLVRLWGFTTDDDTREDVCVLNSAMEEPAMLPWVEDDNHDDETAIKCKICSEEFMDEQELGTHWMDNHKKEAQWLFRGYACAICLDSFTNKKVLETHVQDRHRVQFVEQCMLLQCIPCGSHFGNNEELWSHVLVVHPDDFRPSKAVQHTLSADDGSPRKFELSNSASVENTSQNQANVRKFVCRFCGLKFDLLPDLGRHHQAAHMGPSLVSSRPSKRGIRYYAYRLKSGRLSRPRLKKSLAAASYRIRNRANATIKKRIQASKSIGSGGIDIQSHTTEAVSLGRLADSHCSAVARILYSEMQKTKRRPNNLDILSVARTACCKISLEVLLQGKYGILPERLYLKAAKLCSEHNIKVSWHQEGFMCPKGCRDFNALLPSPLIPRPVGTVGHKSQPLSDPFEEKWEVDESHYVVGSNYLSQRSLLKAHILCDDISFGQETVPLVCVADEDLLDSLPANEGSSTHQTAGHSMPWESFTYTAKPLLDQSPGLDTECLQLRCSCPHSACDPEACDHVYLFDNDYDDAKDIHGKPMLGRFPYDDRGRIILEEGYLVYECNQMCTCNRTCPNRALQNGVRVNLEVFKTEKMGWGVRAGEVILRGTFICEYIGEILDENEANKRRNRYGKDGYGYLYEIDAHINDMSRLVEGQAQFVIDSTNYGNVSRFINHSCSPNLVNYQVLVESMDSDRAHIGLYANRDIALGEELTYDYRYKLLPGGGCPCYCGSPRCRGRLY
ncbi:histone-lysine N-methyltransferase SUVR5 [Argentina anserina]|uniref:histone-lysine N-methyltransferase SUVR5 n=1 Tax=Argentina anserina TaxID=57926 RepID=UPI00217688C2|nr:histone-lysine N-methyltransferase SUVR5 [Potentilla anserina]XP_050388141.1 histone-lysine N-methyltransferase SUVR5 [Potentilla anserina]